MKKIKTGDAYVRNVTEGVQDAFQALSSFLQYVLSSLEGMNLGSFQEYFRVNDLVILLDNKKF